MVTSIVAARQLDLKNGHLSLCAILDMRAREIQSHLNIISAHQRMLHTCMRTCMHISIVYIYVMATENGVTARACTDKRFLRVRLSSLVVKLLLEVWTQRNCRYQRRLSDRASLSRLGICQCLENRESLCLSSPT